MPYEISNDSLKRIPSSTSPIVTVSFYSDISTQIASVLSDKKSDDAKAVTRHFTETRFTKNGIERKTTSDFGLIGSIIAQLAPEE